MKRFTALAVAVIFLCMGVTAYALEDVSGKKGTTLGKKQPYNGIYLEGTNSIVSEGETYNAYETTITFTEPTADRTITVPDSTGTIMLLSAGASYQSITIATDNVALAAADCGKVYGMGTAAKAFTLPATIAGCVYTFVNTGAATNNIVTVDTNAADQIFGNTRADNGDKTSHVGAAGEAINNTAATSDRGDFLTVIGDGVDGWYIIGSTGIWAEDTP